MSESARADGDSRNRTALAVAWLRAAHQVIDHEPRILTDPASVAVLGEHTAEVLRADPRAQSAGARALRSHVVLRSRYAEDRLDLAVRRGVRRYVILGAGYDTFSVRQPSWAADIQVVEVDRPEIQADKRARLEAAGLRPPANVRFVSIDFESETLAAGLARQGVDLGAGTFFSWLGVTMYLTEPAIDAVLSTVVSAPRGSEIVFTFAPALATTGDESPVAGTLAGLAAAVGEPWRTYFEPNALVRKLRDLGFSSVKLLDPGEAERRYFAERSDALPAPKRATIASAIV